MASIASGGRYRIVETLQKNKDYTALRAVDIETRSRQTVLINRYQSPKAIRSVLPEMETVAARKPVGFVAISVESGAVDVVFDYPSAQPLLQEYNKKNRAERETAYTLLEQYLHQLLLLADYPMRLLNAAACPENVRVQKASRKLYCGVMIPPETPTGMDTVLAGISVVAETLLTRKFFSFGFEIAFLNALKEKQYQSLAAVYSAFRLLERCYEEKRAESESKIGLAKLLYFLGERKKIVLASKSGKDAEEQPTQSPEA